MNIVCLGGGPAGLYFGLLMKLRHPEHHIVVLERNKPYDTFGWGVVFSDATMLRLQVADPVTASEILGAFNHWDDIAVHFKGETMRSGGHGFCGIGRKRLLNILQKRCEEVGVKLVFEAEVDANVDIGAQYKADFAMFGLGTTNMTPKAQALLTEVSKTLAAMPNKVAIRGHTDSVQFANTDDRNNWTLSAERAEETRKIIEKKGIPGNRFAKIEGVADTAPYNPNDPKDPRNRRISITVMNQ